MYDNPTDAWRLIKLQSKFSYEQARMMGEAESYMEMCWKHAKTVIPRYVGLLYNFEEHRYDQYQMDNIILTDEESFKKAYIKLCKLKYSFQYPTVFSVFTFPIDIEVEDDLHIVRYKCAIIFAQSEIQTKYGIYQEIDGRLVYSKKFTKEFYPKKYMMNLGYVVGIVPGNS